MRLSLSRLLVILLLFSSVTSIFSHDYTWTGIGSGDDWSTPANWSSPTGITYPQVGDSATIPSGFNVNSDIADILIDSLNIDTGSTLQLIVNDNLIVSGISNIAGDIVSLSGDINLVGGVSATLGNLTSTSGDIVIGSSPSVNQTGNIITGADLYITCTGLYSEAGTIQASNLILDGSGSGSFNMNQNTNLISSLSGSGIVDLTYRENDAVTLNNITATNICFQSSIGFSQSGGTSINTSGLLLRGATPNYSIDSASNIIATLACFSGAGSDSYTVASSTNLEIGTVSVNGDSRSGITGVANLSLSTPGNAIDITQDILVGSLSITANDFDDTGTVTINTSDDVTLTLGAASPTSLSGSWVFSGSTDLTSDNKVFNNIQITGSCSASDALNVLGHWTNSGTFNHSNNSVVFVGIGSTSNISGNTTFYDFSCTADNKNLNFSGGSTQTIDNDFTITGSSGNEIDITGSSTWNLSVSNPVNVEYANITNSSVNTLQEAYNSSFSVGTNSNWVVYSTSDREFHWHGGNGILWNDPLNWSEGYVPGIHTDLQDVTVIVQDVSNQPTLADNITLDELTIENDSGSGSLDVVGQTVTITSTLNNNGIIYRRSGSSVSITDSDSGLTYYRNADGAIQLYSGVDYYNLTIDNIASISSEIDLAGNLTITGSFDTNGNQLNVEGNITCSGSFTHSNGLVVLDGNGNISGMSGANLFYNLNISADRSLSNSVEIENQLNITDGTLTANYLLTTNNLSISGDGSLDGSGNIDVGNDVSLSGTGSLLGGDRTIYVESDWTESATIFNLLSGTSSVIFDGISSTIISESGFDNLTISSSTTMGSNLSINNDLLVTTGSSLANDGFGIDISGDFQLNNSASISMTGTGTLEIDGDTSLIGTALIETSGSGNLTFSGEVVCNINSSITGSSGSDPEWYFEDDVTFGLFDPVGDGVTFSGDSTCTLQNNTSFERVIVQDGVTVLLAGTSEFSTLSNLQIGTTAGSMNSTAIFDAANVEFDISQLDNGGRFRLTGDQVLQNFGTFDNNSGWVVYNGSGTLLNNADLSSFWNLEIDGSGTYILDQDITILGVGNNFDGGTDYDDEGIFISGGSLDANSNQITVYEAFVQDGGTFVPNGGDLVFNQNYSCYIGGTSDIDLFNLTVSTSSTIGKYLYIEENITLNIENSIDFDGTNSDTPVEASDNTPPTIIPSSENCSWLTVVATDFDGSTDHFWFLAVDASANFTAEYVRLFGCNSSTPLPAPNDNDFLRLYYCNNLRYNNPVLSSRTLDTDNNGFIDRIEVTVESPISTVSPFSDFEAEVVGYSLSSTPYTLPAAGVIFYIDIIEGRELDTDAQPQWRIVNNNSLQGNVGNYLIELTGFDTPEDNAEPILAYTLAICDTDQGYVRFSEPVTISGFTTSLAGSLTYTPISGIGEEFVIDYDSTITAINVLNSETITATGPISDFAGTPNPIAGSTTHRISDIGLGITGNSIVQPLWAKGTTNVSNSNGEGIISTFDGSENLEVSDIIHHANTHEAPAGVLELRFSQNIDNSFRSSSGLWIPGDGTPTFFGLTPIDYPDFSTTQIPMVPVNGNLYSTSILESALENNKAIEFFYYYVTEDLYCGYIPDETSSSWYNQVQPWSFTVNDIIDQGSGVSILNNVIYPANGDVTTIHYELKRDGMVSVQVFDLAGGMVEILHRGRQNAGEYNLVWNGTNRAGNIVARGIYFIRVVGPGVDEIRELIIAK